MNGFLEQFNTHAISGWIPKDKNNSVKIKISGNPIFEITADIERPDLKGKGSGFLFLLAQNNVVLEKSAQVNVSVFYGDNSDEITNSPQWIVVDEIEKSKVLKGNNEWLFLQEDSNRTLDYLCKKITLSEDILQKWIAVFFERANYCSINKIKYYHVVCPEKEVVMKSFLPEGYKISGLRPCKVIKDSLSQYNNFVYDEFQKWSDKENYPYYRGDTHWTYHGAYYYYKLLKSLIQDDGLLLANSSPDYNYSKDYQVSDLLRKIEDINVEEIDFTKSQSNNIKIRYSNELATTGREQVYVNPEGRFRALIFHTSSIDWMKPFINDDFAEVYYIWNKSIDFNRVREIEPDVLIYQTNERFITSAPSDVF